MIATKTLMLTAPAKCEAALPSVLRSSGSIFPIVFALGHNRTSESRASFTALEI
jgi:hypothetical protein